jgi:DegV family protein with EDD domain
MKKIALVSDDICSLPPTLIREFEIEIVKTKMSFPEWEEWPERNIYKVIKETKKIPKTAAPSPGDFLKAYQKLKDNSEKILVITVSARLSGVFNSAFSAKELFEDPSKIFLFDSGSAVAGEGLIVLRAAELIKEGKEIEEILKELESLKKKVKIFAFLKTLFWARKTGRVLIWQKFAFDILKIFGVTPYLGIREGEIKFFGFNTWTFNQLNAIFNQIKREAKKGKIRVGINYTDNIEFALRLKEKIEKELKLKVSFFSSVPLIVGAVTGPGTLILACHNL